jgi:hypothetical protein
MAIAAPPAKYGQKTLAGIERTSNARISANKWVARIIEQAGVEYFADKLSAEGRCGQ